MPRAPRDYRLDTREARSKLKARTEPYWRAIVPGTFLGYRKGKRSSAWIVRQRQGDSYAEQRIGTPNDHADADGEVVLSYAQAVERATTTQLEQRAPAPRHYGDGLTLNAVFDAYLEARQTTPGGRSNRVMPASTANVSRQFWNRHAREGIGRKLVTALDAEALRRWHAAMAQTPPTNRGRIGAFDPADPDQVRARRATANRVLTIAKAALRHARNAGTLPDSLPDYWQRVQPFHLGDDPPPRMLEQDEVTRLLNSAAPDLREVLTGALMTGARYGELCGLRSSDYSADNGLVRIRQSKTGKTLWQPLTAEGRGFFDRMTAGKPASALIFTRADGRPWGKSDARRPMAEAVTAAGLNDDVSFKTTRATYGKLLLLATRDLELVAKALGHSDSRITRKHYAALLPSEVAAGVARMPALGVGGDHNVSRIARKRRP